MDLRVTGRHIEVSEVDKKHLGDRIARLTKHFDGVQKLDAVVSAEGTNMKVELVAHAVKGVIAAEGVGISVEAAIDQALDRMDRQIKKVKERIKERRG